MARDIDVSAVAIAWSLHRGLDMLIIFGKTIDQVVTSV